MTGTWLETILGGDLGSFGEKAVQNDLPSVLVGLIHLTAVQFFLENEAIFDAEQEGLIVLFALFPFDLFGK